MAEKNILQMTVGDFMSALAAKTPTPGGGSAAGIAGALAVALGEMSVHFTQGKKKFAEHEEFYKHLDQRLATARRMFQELIADDMAAFEFLQEASAAPDSPEKSATVQLAVSAAINVPREMAKLSLAVMQDLASLLDKCNPWLISDLAAGAALAATVVRLSNYNVLVNTPQLEDVSAAQEIRTAAANDLARAGKLLKAIESAAAEFWQ